MQEVWGYQPCLWKMILVGVGAVCSGGLLLLLFYWLPEWGVKGTCTHTSLRDAHTVLLRTTVGKRLTLLSFFEQVTCFTLCVITFFSRTLFSYKEIPTLGYSAVFKKKLKLDLLYLCMCVNLFPFSLNFEFTLVLLLLLLTNHPDTCYILWHTSRITLQMINSL